jgi:hypothetical protein
MGLESVRLKTFRLVTEEPTSRVLPALVRDAARGPLQVKALDEELGMRLFRPDRTTNRPQRCWPVAVGVCAPTLRDVRGSRRKTTRATRRSGRQGSARRVDPIAQYLLLR